MVSTVPDRQDLARLCASRDWSKAIRILDSLLSRSCSVQDICNRAYCYSQLELHKHVIKDCDNALRIDSTLLQAYILKGCALSALGKKEDAVHVWEKGYELAIRQSADLKQLLELEELLNREKPSEMINACVDTSEEPTSTVTSASDSGSESQLESVDTNDIHKKLKDGSEVCIKPNCVLGNQKIFASVTSRNKSISLDLRLSRGIAKVNEGKYDQAITIFDQILRDNPAYSEALIGRGTAYAFQRELESAIADFSKAIKSNSLAGEAWKRRGQARAALGESAEAIEDLTKALEFEPQSSDILHERGIVNFKFKDYNAAIEDLSSCIKLDKDNKSAYSYLGLALASIGEHKRAEEAHLKAIQLDPCFVDGWAHLAQLYQELVNTKKAFDCLKQLLAIDERFIKAYHLHGLLHHGMGAHRTAIKYLSMGLSIERSNLECLYLRGSCYHAIGEYGDAIKDYDAVLDLELDTMEKFALQCLAFYQKEMALYTASKIGSEFCWFDIDGDLDPLFKEYWCKRLHPKNVCEKVFRQPPLRESHRKGRLRKQDLAVTKHKIILLEAADVIGKKIQYDSPGFLPNKRQYRMAGLAAIEIAQKVSRAWRASKSMGKNGKKTRRNEKLNLPVQNRGGDCCSTSSSLETSTSHGYGEDRSTSNHFTMSWRDIYSIAVKWRQISEPCDAVVWVNKLSEEFNSGFGSHTPMILGQTKVVRYYANYRRTFNLAKTIIGEKRYVNNASDEAIDLSKDGRVNKIKNARSCSDLYTIVGEDFWVSTSCYSTAFEGKLLEGTRITLQKMGERGYDFAIRTPCTPACTPARWDDYDTEMALSWEAICNSYCIDAYGSTDMKALENVRNAILRMTYYWYNFMPLSRGSAVVGYIVLLGLFLAANMVVTGSIPTGVQVDWEAILSPDPDEFLQSVKSWLYPSIKLNKSWRSYPDVASTFNTTGSVVAALSTYSD
ncbi:hypothetical protein H6P81_020439 [Aristolochia fimbriata]|uniref:Suppressor of RPS4-RLD 1 n=1 Tax=Aristolochia fimbriata TaxID=158543 RepID=A0AAV7DWA2_ARIFI|nr:hypothetical protein H6P81_020439 [Aristolochia fimbriata]